MLDLLIRNGSVIDGSGRARFPADVAIEGGRLAEIGRLDGAQAVTFIDAAGCIVAPGFVDMHSHGDLTLPLVPHAESLVYQGVTTAVVGQCGLTFVPLLPETRAAVLASVAGDLPFPVDQWSTFRSYLDYLEGLKPSLNVTSLVGHRTIRAAVMLFAQGPADAAQLARMRAEVAKAMDEGAIGISTGLIYPPGSYASTEEVIEVTRPAGERSGYYFSHMRGEDDRLLSSVAEAIRIGAETGASVQISHFKASGPENWHLSAPALELIDQARAQGLEVTADVYPYTAGSTGLVNVLPGWAREGGNAALLRRLAEPETRQRMKDDMAVSGFFRHIGWNDIMICGAPAQRQFQGHMVAELAAGAGKEPHDWVFDALIDAKADMDMILFAMSEDNVRMALKHPATMIGTDGDIVAPVGPFGAALPHPRHYGTFPKVLGRYVRELGLLTLEEAIWKMTGFPAKKLRWADRGLLRNGYRADVVVFDPDTVLDTATYQAPHQYPVGISYVIVNGELVVNQGVHTGARSGMVLRRSA